MKKDFNVELKRLISATISDLSNDGKDITLHLSTGAAIQSSYWRLLSSKGQRLSSFDHHQIYGLKEPMNAVDQLKKSIVGKKVLEIECSKISGDIRIICEDSIVLEIFNFTGNEVWEVEFEDGSGQYSNYV